MVWKGVFNKGQVSTFKIFASNDKFPIVFKSLIDPVDVVDEKKINVVQEFTALMYGICQFMKEY